MVYGADYRNGKPCLVNTVAHMTYANHGRGGTGIPSKHFDATVTAFDAVNRALEASLVNDGSGYVSELAADILLRNFGTLKPLNIDTGIPSDTPESRIVSYSPERTDAEFAADLFAAMNAPAPEDIVVDEYTRQHVEYRMGTAFTDAD